MAVLSWWDEPARSSPKKSRMTGATEPPKVVHHTIPRLDALRGR